MLARGQASPAQRPEREPVGCEQHPERLTFPPSIQTTVLVPVHVEGLSSPDKSGTVITSAEFRRGSPESRRPGGAAPIISSFLVHLRYPSDTLTSLLEKGHGFKGKTPWVGRQIECAQSPFSGKQATTPGSRTVWWHGFTTCSTLCLAVGTRAAGISV